MIITYGAQCMGHKNGTHASIVDAIQSNMPFEKESLRL